MNTELSLADLLSRGVSVEWFEGVAIVREVIDRLAQRAEFSNKVPEPVDIMLSPIGLLSVRRAAQTDEPIRRLGQLLQAAVGRSDTPVQLRLVIANATAPEPGYGSTTELSEALAYFERPQRGLTLQQLFERASAAPPGSNDHESLTLDRIAPLPARRRSEPPRRTFNLRPLLYIAAAVAILVVSFAGAARVLRMRSAAPTRSRVIAVARRMSTAAADSVIAGVSAVTDRVGLGRVVPADAASAVAAEPASLVGAAARQRPHAAAAADSQKPAFAVFDLERVALPEQPAGGVDMAGRVGPTGAVPATSVADAREPAIVAASDSTMYSAESAGVEAPIAIRPQLPTQLPPTIKAEDLSRIELVVDTEGSVESVKLIGPHPSFHAKMLLSVAKAWQFRPALKNGRAVRFRKTVWLAEP